MRLIWTLFFVSFSIFAGELEQQIDINPRYFPNGDNYASDISLGYDLKYHTYTENEDLLVASFNSVISNKDDGRGYVDIGELYWNKQADKYEIKIGVDTVFWGVAESANVVDVINQKNYLTDDDKDKLGELMARWSYFFEDGNLDVFYLPEFRERKFIKKGYRGGVNIGDTTYEHKNKQSIVLRYKKIIDNLDIGLSYFNGIDRQPQLSVNGSAFDVYYPKLQQFGLDVQLTQDDILWKFEYANKQYTNSSEYAGVYGFEYLTVNDWNVNFLLEHNKNSQKTNALQNDLMFGIRLDLNDESGSEALIGFIYDLDYYSKMISFEGSSRIDNNSKIILEASYINPKANDNTLQNIKDNDNISLTLSYYF